MGVNPGMMVAAAKAAGLALDRHRKGQIQRTARSLAVDRVTGETLITGVDLQETVTEQALRVRGGNKGEGGAEREKEGAVPGHIVKKWKGKM